MLKAYFAAPLFSDAERAFNVRVTSELSRHVDVFLPQRDGKLIVDLLDSGCSPTEAKKQVFDFDIEAIRNSDLIISVLDGRAIDEGVAIELGYGFAIGKPCWGLKTDFRSLAWFGDNPMVEMVLAKRFDSVGSLIEAVRSFATREWMVVRNA
jgi:nucleoside 2-deoxyribosyltransferase